MTNYACVVCPSGSYLYTPPVDNTNCLICDTNAVCKGSNIVYPLAGYWRENDTSDDFILCPRTESCLEGNETNLMGICDEGYEGIVCAEC